MRRLVPTALAALFAITASAHEGHERHFPAERLEPGVDKDAIINTSWASVPQHLEWDAALILGYSNDPLYTYVVSTSGNPVDRDKALVENRLAGHLTASVAFFNWLQLGADLPVLLFQQRDGTRAPASDEGELGTMGVGDLRLYPKARILRQRDGAPLDIGLQMPVTIPTGQTTDFFGEQGFTFTPTILASREFSLLDGTLRLAGNLGTRFRTEPVDFDEQNALGTELIARAGGSYVFYVAEERPTEIGLSLVSAPQIEGFLENIPTRSPAEVLGEIDHTVWGPLGVFLGGAVGLQSGAGGPDFRVFGGLRFAPRAAPDRDNDGIADRADKCVADPETKNGFEDEDGCPDVDDKDKDGIRDADDQCPDVPEDKDGFEDTDGCVDNDHDHDGLDNDADKCPTDAEDKDNFEDEDGCPELDNDKDGIADKDDKCPADAEDKDTFQDDDGCPEVDNDADLILDAADKCPVQAGPKENNGCPDTDRDGDTVVDRLDNCPDEAGAVDNAGCKKKQLVRLQAEKIEILDKVFFATGKDVIQKKSYELLDNIAAVLSSHPEIKSVRVEGHTDNAGDAAKNKDLSDRRAKAVVKYLTDKGIAADRLVGEGFGQERPIADNATEEGKANNRRVDFAIVQGT